MLLGQVAAGHASAVHPTQPLIAPKPKGKADLPLQQVSGNVAQINNSGTQFNVRNTVVKQAVCQSPQSESNEPVNITIKVFHPIKQKEWKTFVLKLKLYLK